MFVYVFNVVSDHLNVKQTLKQILPLLQILRRIINLNQRSVWEYLEYLSSSDGTFFVKKLHHRCFTEAIINPYWQLSTLNDFKNTYWRCDNQTKNLITIFIFYGFSFVFTGTQVDFKILINRGIFRTKSNVFDGAFCKSTRQLSWLKNSIADVWLGSKYTSAEPIIVEIGWPWSLRLG